MSMELYLREICGNSYTEFAKRLEEGKLLLRERTWTAYYDIAVYYDIEYCLEVIARFYIGE